MTRSATNILDVRGRQGLLLAAVVLAAVFLIIASGSEHYWDEYFYLYSVLAHEPAGLLQMEPQLGGLFPPGFYAGKIGFIYLLDGLVDLLGGGPQSLAMINAVFSVLAILTALASYALIVQLLPGRDALPVTVIILFSPLLIYFNGKVMTELPSLLMAILAAASFLKSFNAPARNKYFWLLLATILLFAAVWLRFIVVVFYAGMIIGLFVLNDSRYPFTKVFVRALLTGTGSVVLLLLAWLVMLDDPAGSIGGLVGNLSNRSQGVIIRLYALVMFVQLFGLYIFAALWRPGSAQFRFAATWALLATLPFLLGSSYAEPRFFYMALIPLAMLVYLGMRVLSDRWPAVFAGYRGWLMFALVVVVNRAVFVPLMPIEHDQEAYQALVSKDMNNQANAQYMTPWVSDYSLLKFIYPHASVYLVMDWAYDGDEGFFSSSAFQRWVGADNYLANYAELSKLPQPWHYAGWDYSPVIKRMQSMSEKLGIPVQGINEGQKNHLELGWPWNDKNLARRMQLTDGHYEIHALFPLDSDR